MRQQNNDEQNIFCARLVRRALGIAVLASAAAAHGASAQNADVLAVVNGKPITVAEVDTKAGAPLAKLNEQLYSILLSQN